MILRPLVLLFLALPLLAHKFHVSYTTAEWNEETKSLEMVLQLFPDDLEAAISLFKGEKVALSRKNEAVIFDYLKTQFNLVDAQGRPVALTWVGMEIGVDRVWAYLEAPIPSGLEGVTLYQGTFFDLFDDQVNSVNVLINQHANMLVFERDSKKKLLKPQK